MEKIITGELLAKLYLELDNDEKAFFFNVIGANFRTKVNCVENLPNPKYLGRDGLKAIKSFDDPYFSERLDERSQEKLDEGVPHKQYLISKERSVIQKEVAKGDFDAYYDEDEGYYILRLNPPVTII